jgi:hypothetical protein
VYVATGDVFGDGTPKILVSEGEGAGSDPDAVAPICQGRSKALTNAKVPAPIRTLLPHSQAELGLDVFAKEEAAVHKVADHIQHSRGVVPVQALEDDLRKVVGSYEELAQIAIAGAGDGDPKEVRKAKAALLEGQNDFATAFADGAFHPDRLDDTVADFRAAWEHALKAKH